MTVFADSSALVKLYADEPDADRVRGVELVVVSAVARVEVPAALWRKSRTGELAVADAALLSEVFALEWAQQRRFVPVACAVVARRADPGVDTVLCYDHDLNDAAAREGFWLLPA